MVSDRSKAAQVWAFRTISLLIRSASGSPYAGKTTATICSMVHEVDQISQFLTFNLKLREPSRHKAALVHRAMRQATLARVALLKKWESDPQFTAALEGKLDKRQVRMFASQLVRLANAKHPITGPLGSLRDGVVEDCASMLKSRLRLLSEHDDQAGAADLRPREAGLGEGLALLATATTLDQQNEARDLMARKAIDELRPLSFTRFRGNDGFMLMQDVEGRVFVALPLADAPSYREGKSSSQAALFCFRTGEAVKPVGRAVLYPVDCGKWQLERLRAGTPRSAKLSYRDGTFTLHVTVEMLVDAGRMADQVVIGVDRGIDEIASVVARDRDGNVLEAVNIEGETLRSLQRKAEARARYAQRTGTNVRPLRVKYAADVIVHEASRQIVDMAARHRAFIAVEELSHIVNGPHRRRAKGAPRRAKALNRQLSRGQYAKLEAQVRYKARLAGLVDNYGREAVVTINGAWTSQRCAECGHVNRANRTNRSEFKCVECGHEAHADLNAARNIAGKGFAALSRMSEAAAKKGRTLLPASLLDESRTTASAAIRSFGAETQPSARKKPPLQAVVAEPAGSNIDDANVGNAIEIKDLGQ